MFNFNSIKLIKKRKLSTKFLLAVSGFCFLTWSQQVLANQTCIGLFEAVRSQVVYDTSTLEPNHPSAIEQRVSQLESQIKQDHTVYEHLSVSHEKDLQTIRVKLSGDKIDPKTGLRPGTQVYMVFMPGFGGENSYLKSILTNIGAYNKDKLSSTLKKVNKEGLLIKTTTEGLELPGRTGAIDINQVARIEQFLAWYENYLIQLKSEIGDHTPVVLVGRSGSGTLAWLVQSYFNAKYGRDFIAGTVAINPVLADIRTLDASEKALYESTSSSAEHGFVYREIDAWSYALYRQMAADKKYFDPINDPYPRMVFLSAKDDQVIPQERSILAEAAAANGRFFDVRIFDTDKHDILTLGSDQIRLEANLALFQFLTQISANFGR